MRKTNKKGFTIVELVIVIAVIAILAAVMIPTFGNVTKNAKENARDQEAKNALTEYLVDNNADATDVKAIVVEEDGKYYVYTVTDGNITVEGDLEPVPSLSETDYVCNPDNEADEDEVFIVKIECEDGTDDPATAEVDESADNKCNHCGETIPTPADGENGENQ